MVECIAQNPEFSPHTIHKLCVVVHVYNPSTQFRQFRSSRSSALHREFKAHLGFMRTCVCFGLEFGGFCLSEGLKVLGFCFVCFPFFFIYRCQHDTLVLHNPFKKGGSV